MSSHYRFQVDISTPGETDDEEEQVRAFAALVESLASKGGPGFRVRVGDVERA